MCTCTGVCVCVEGDAYASTHLLKCEVGGSPCMQVRVCIHAGVCSNYSVLLLSDKSLALHASRQPVKQSINTNLPNKQLITVTCVTSL